MSHTSLKTNSEIWLDLDRGHFCQSIHSYIGHVQAWQLSIAHIRNTWAHSGFLLFLKNWKYVFHSGNQGCSWECDFNSNFVLSNVEKMCGVPLWGCQTNSYHCTGQVPWAVPGPPAPCSPATQQGVAMSVYWVSCARGLGSWRRWSPYLVDSCTTTPRK